MLLNFLNLELVKRYFMGFFHYLCAIILQRIRCILHIGIMHIYHTFPSFQRTRMASVIVRFRFDIPTYPD